MADLVQADLLGRGGSLPEASDVKLSGSLLRGQVMWGQPCTDLNVLADCH